MTAAAVIQSPVAGAATPANQDYVRALYGDLLDRSDTTTDPAGVDFWANRLATHSKLDVARSIQYSSDEYFRHLADIGYAVYLDRAADPAGRNFLVQGWMARRFTYQRMVATLVGSHEYFALAGSTNGGFVDRAFADILGSEPSTSARNYFVGVAASQGRARVAILLATSHQALTAFVSYQYDSFLGRSVDPPSLTYWVDRLSNGFRREDFDVTLVSSSEYYAKNS
jgi:hypothetical protein